MRWNSSNVLDRRADATVVKSGASPASTLQHLQAMLWLRDGDPKKCHLLGQLLRHAVHLNEDPHHRQNA